MTTATKAEPQGWRRAAIDISPLRHVAFRRLWAGNAIAFVGFQITAVAVAVQVYDVTGSSFWVGMLGAAGLVPLIVFGLWGGAVADAIDRRRLLLFGSLLLWTSTGGLFAQAATGLDNLGVLLALVALQSAGFAVASSTRGAIVPRLLPEEMVAAANTLSFTTSNVATLGGPLLAGILIADSSVTAAYAADALLFTAALYAAIRLPKLPPGEIREAPGLRSVIDGLAFIATRPVLLMSFLVDIAAMVIAMPRALFPARAQTLGGGSAVGWLFASLAIGAVVVGATSGWIGRVRRQGGALVVAIVVWGLAVAASGLADRLWLTVALLAVGGAADLVSAVYRQTMLQTYAPDEMRGRMQGVFIVVVAGGPRLGDVRAGATADWFGTQAAWVGGGLVCSVVVLAALAVPAFRNYDAAASRPD
ncbi:MAG TPA: MFS transporter [Sporichthyaceae bacterium]|jgi:MFS family permease|nr:MFS transporter [Sporichthyaceae bacterium]